MPLPAPSQDTTCLVTGASSGIGAAIARQLAARGHGVTLVARREEPLRQLADELAAEHGVRAEVIVADVTDADARASMTDEIGRRGLTVDVVVNNAGFGSGGRFQDLDMEREQEMVRVNVAALHSLCARYVPEMVSRGRGGVLNVASTASFQPLPRQATYSATKSFVLNFTQALAADLHGTGVSATALCPGVTRTEFFDTGDIADFSSRMPGFVVMEASEVARLGVEGLASGRPVVVPGVFNRLGAVSGQMTPRRLLLPLMRRMYPIR